MILFIIISDFHLFVYRVIHLYNPGAKKVGMLINNKDFSRYIKPQPAIGKCK